MTILERFLREQYNREFIKHEDSGILVYSKYDDGSVYVQIFYVLEDETNKGIGTKMITELIEKENPTMIVCDVDYANKDYIDSIRKFTNYGFNFLKEITNAVVLYKVL